MKAAPQEPVATTVNNAQGSSSSKAGANEPLPVVVGAGSSLVARSILAPPEAVGAAAAAVGKGAATAPAPIVATGPVPGKPALQSSRLYSGIVPPVHLTGAVGDIGITKLDLGMSGASLSKKMLLKMTMYLRELDVPETPLPTRAVCDLVETVKQDAVTLLSLHNVIAKKEKELVQLTAVSRSTDSGAGSSKGTDTPLTCFE